MEIARHLTPNDLKLVPQGGLNKAQADAWNAAYGPRNEAFKKLNLQGKDLVSWKYQRYMKDYLRCVAAVDDEVGRLLDWLDESGLAKNTVVIYASDQGFYLGEHGWYDKRWMYEESLRTPFVVRWPGVIKPESVRSEFVSNLDFAATLLEIAGAAVPDDMQGVSLVPLLKGEPAPADWRKPFYYHYYEFAEHRVPAHYGVRTERYKLIHYYRSDEWELFDLQEDPHELRSVYNDEKYADALREAKAELARLRAHYKDDSPAKEK
jgi:arylsulfatase A-like enzyme